MWGIVVAVADYGTEEEEITPASGPSKQRDVGSLVPFLTSWASLCRS